VRSRVDLPVLDSGKPFRNVNVNFPRQCIYCNKPVETWIETDVSSELQTRNRRAYYSAKLQMPYCREHETCYQQYKRKHGVWLAVLAIVVLLLFVGGYLLTAHFTKYGFFMLLAFCVGIIAVLDKVLIYTIPRFREIPTWFQHGALGVTVKIESAISGARLEFNFTNKEYAAEFARLNGSVLSSSWVH